MSQHIAGDDPNLSLQEFLDFQDFLSCLTKHVFVLFIKTLYKYMFKIYINYEMSYRCVILSQYAQLVLNSAREKRDMEQRHAAVKKKVVTHRLM